MSEIGAPRTGCGDPKIVIEFDDDEKWMNIFISDKESSITAEIKIQGKGAPPAGCCTYTLVRDFIEAFIKRNLRPEK